MATRKIEATDEQGDVIILFVTNADIDTTGLADEVRSSRRSLVADIVTADGRRVFDRIEKGKYRLEDDTIVISDDPTAP